MFLEEIDEPIRLPHVQATILQAVNFIHYIEMKVSFFFGFLFEVIDFCNHHKNDPEQQADDDFDDDDDDDDKQHATPKR